MTTPDPMAHVEFAEPHVSYYPPYIRRAADGMDFYEIPEPLIATYEQASAAIRAAEEAIRRHIADNNVPLQDGLAEYTQPNSACPPATVRTS